MKKIIFYILSLLILTLDLFAQGGGSIGVSNPVAAGMGNSYVTTSRGVYAIHKNPANLSLSPTNEFELATVVPLPTLNTFAGTDFMSISEYNYFFGGVQENGQTVGRLLTQSDKDRLRGLFADGGTISEDFSITLLAFTFNAGKEIGAFGFSIDDNEYTKFTIPQSVIDLGLEGNPVDKVYDFSALSAKGSWIRDYTLSYSRDLTDIEFLGDIFNAFSAGISLKMVQGFGYLSTEKVNSQFVTSSNQNELRASGDFSALVALSPDLGIQYDFDSTSTTGGFTPFPTPAGSGFGVDLGFTAQLDETWTFGLAITDIGTITWDTNIAEYSSTSSIVIDDVTDANAVDSIFNTLKGEGKYYNGTVSSDLPTAFRVGAACQVDRLVDGFPGKMVVTTELNLGFNDEARNSTKPRISLGLEYRPIDLIPIRTGFTAGGLYGFGWSLGTGIDAGLFSFDIAAQNFGNVINGNDAQTVNFSIGTRWRF